MEALLIDLLPRILPPAVPRRIIEHGSKWQLLKQVPVRLIGYAKIPQGDRPKALVLVDRDDDDCRILKAQLEEFCRSAGLMSKGAATGSGFDVVNRIVVEELEAWYLGDIEAVRKAWNRVAPRAANRARYRDPDAVVGGTHEAFLALLQQAGHLKGATKLPKIDAARRMVVSLDPDRNRSHSFRQFVTGLRALVEAA